MEPFEKFYPMIYLLEPAETEHYAIEHFDVSESEARMFSINPHRGHIRAGSYVRLVDKRRSIDRVWMSDTPAERGSNYGVLWHANGDVLIGGLGMGMILYPIANNPAVTSVTVVEIDPEVVELVWTQLKDHVPEDKVNIVVDDILTWQPEKGRKWDTIYFDIWLNICADNWEEMKTLHRRFGRRLNRDNPKAWIYSWQRDRIEYEVRREKAYGW